MCLARRRQFGSPRSSGDAESSARGSGAVLAFRGARTSGATPNRLHPDEQLRNQTVVLGRCRGWRIKCRSIVPMTLRVETTHEGQRVVIHLAGRIQAEDLGDLESRIARNGSIVLDLDEVMLVGVEVVRFLSNAEAAGVELRHCPAFVREWIDREREVDR